MKEPNGTAPEGVSPEGKEPDAQCRLNCGPCREPRGKIHATNWLENISTSADYPVVQVQFKNTRNGFYTNPEKLRLEIGDMVAVEASPGHDIGRVSMVGPLVGMQMKKSRLSLDSDLKKVFRKAKPVDLERFEEAKAREHKTMIRSRVIAEELGLNMKIGDVEFQGDGGKAIFYYIADERVDFRKLIRLLADEFKIRIEMKQIGARQEAGRIGGIGPCGRPLCCSSWMTHFVSVGTGAARMQDLSMNPQKLAGQCAKLKCCLNFEIDNYAESVKKLPPKDTVFQTKEADYYIFKIDILTRRITLSTDKKVAANLETIDSRRAFEIISLNKQGIKVDAIRETSDSEPEKREYIDLTDQDSLTRFDSQKRNRRKKGKENQQGNRQKERDGKEAKGQQGNRDKQPRGKQPQKQNPQQRQQNAQQQKAAQNAQQRAAQKTQAKKGAGQQRTNLRQPRNEKQKSE